MRVVKHMVLVLGGMAFAVGVAQASPPISFTFQITNNAPTVFAQPNASGCAQKHLNSLSAPHAPTVQWNANGDASRFRCPSTTITSGTTCTISEEDLAQGGPINFGLSVQYYAPVSQSYTLHESTQKSVSYNYSNCSLIGPFAILTPGSNQVKTNEGPPLNLEPATVSYLQSASVATSTLTNYTESVSNWKAPISVVFPGATGLADICKEYAAQIETPAGWPQPGWEGQGYPGFAMSAQYINTKTYTWPNTGTNQSNLLKFTQALGCLPDVVWLSCPSVHQAGISGNAAIKTNITSNAMLGTHVITVPTTSTISCYGSLQEGHQPAAYGFKDLHYVTKAQLFSAPVPGGITTSTICPNIFSTSVSAITPFNVSWSGFGQTLLGDLKDGCSYGGGSISHFSSWSSILDSITYKPLHYEVDCTIGSDYQLTCSAPQPVSE